MKVILLKGVPKVGKPDDIVEVNEGYARNALFPRKLAIPATEKAIADLAKKKESRIAEQKMQRTLLDKAIETIQNAQMTYQAPANEKGVLFSKVTSKDIARYLLTKHRVSIDPRCITIPDGAIKHIGEYDLKIQDGSYSATLRIEVTP